MPFWLCVKIATNQYFNTESLHWKGLFSRYLKCFHSNLERVLGPTSNLPFMLYWLWKTGVQAKSEISEPLLTFWWGENFFCYFSAAGIASRGKIKAWASSKNQSSCIAMHFFHACSLPTRNFTNRPEDATIYPVVFDRLFFIGRHNGESCAKI